MLVFFVGLVPCLYAQVNFTGPELLARPTDNSITVNVVTDAALQLYFEYGTESGVYTDQTDLVTSIANEPVNVVINGLQANTRYYYRMVYSNDGGSLWIERAEHSFHTQRPSGSTFTFTILTDSHINIMLGNQTVYQQTLNNVASDNPDLHLDLGDTFAMDNVTSESGARSAYLFQRASNFFGRISPSAPIFIAIGNHEEEEGWHLDDNGNPVNSQPVWGTNARKRYFPNPIPDGFYSGNAETYYALDGDQLHEDYFAWTWGDVLFVVIDPFWYTISKPFTGNTGGGENSDAGTGDRWDWTLGQMQFNWLRQTLENSNAAYKFIFAHHMVGGTQDYVRGGAYGVPYCEWGGYNENGSTWGFDTERAGWGSEPVHQFLVANHVSAFFHGHDHQYAYEVRDGIVYQSCPSGGFTGNGFNLYSEGGYTIKVLPSAGHLRVTVTPEQATVDYIGYSNGAVNYSYEIEPNTPITTFELTMAVEPVGSGTTNPEVGVSTYAEGTHVTLTAMAATGYLFDYWEGDVENVNSASTSVIMDEDQSVIAHFVEDTPPAGIIGDVNNAEGVNSTDALILLSCDAGISVSQFCPMNCGDVNNDALVNSTDALIILSYDVGMSVPFAIGEAGCATTVTQCPGCNPEQMPFSQEY